MREYQKINIGVGGLVLRETGEILLVKRKSDITTWTIPSGYMEEKENVFETILREVKEETGITIKPKGIVGVRQRLERKEGNNIWIIVIADYKSGKATPDHFEVSQAKFIPLGEAIKEKITPITHQILQRLLSKKLKIFLPQKGFNKKHYRFFV